MTRLISLTVGEGADVRERRHLTTNPARSPARQSPYVPIFRLYKGLRRRVRAFCHGADVLLPDAVEVVAAEQTAIGRNSYDRFAR